METHFEGSRGSDNMSSPHQRQYDEQNPDIANSTETDHNNNPENDSDLASKFIDHPEDIDSPVNAHISGTEKRGGSLTNDESANTDPNDVDKPSLTIQTLKNKSMKSPFNYFEDDGDRQYWFGSDDREIDNPGLNQDSALDPKDNENFDESDDFHKYDDVDHSNVPDDDPIAKSNERMNANSSNERPTFNRTYNRNTADKDNIEDSGRFDGTIGI